MARCEHAECEPSQGGNEVERLKNQSVLTKIENGEMAERFKAHAWKACEGLRPPGVRIPLSPPIIAFARNGRMWSVAKRHRMPRTRYAPMFFQAHRERALGDVEVRLSKAQSKTEVLQPIFLFALWAIVMRFLISIVQKLSFQYKYE